MISLWDMIISSRFPDDILYFGIGIAVFGLSLMVSAFIIPLVLHSIWLIVKPMGRKRGIFGAAEYDYNHYRVTLCIFIAVLILQVITTIMCIHGLFFLSNMGLYREYLFFLMDSEAEFSGYIVPSCHHVLYFLEASFEAARENLLLWGFLFLVNYICKLVVKRFYFKIFTSLLIIRVLFVFACSYRIPELIANTVSSTSGYIQVAESISPFHTLSKSLRTLEIFINVVICIYFITYLWREISYKINILENRPDNQEPSPFDAQMNTLCDRTEMVRIKKYSVLYACLLIAELILNLIECQFPNFFYKYFSTTSISNLSLLEMIFSIITDILSFILPLLTVLFILILISSMSESKNNQNDPGNYGSIDGNNETPNNMDKLQLITKRIIVNGSVIFVIAVVITAFTSYLWFSPGNRVHLVLRPGDYLHLDNGDIFKFMQTCDLVTAEPNEGFQFTNFDVVKYKYDLTPGKCLYNDSIVFYENISQPEFVHENINVTDVYYTLVNQVYWYPSGTYFDNFNKNLSISFEGDYLPYPCYYSEYLLTGFVVTCENYSGTRRNVEFSSNINTVSNNQFVFPQTGVFYISNISDSSFTFSVHRLMYKPNGGKIYSYNNIPQSVNIKEMKLIQFEYVELIHPHDFCHVYLVCHYSYWSIAIAMFGTFFLVVFYLSFMFVLVSVCNFKLQVFTTQK